MNPQIRFVVPAYASLVMIWALTPLSIVWSVAGHVGPKYPPDAEYARWVTTGGAIS